jgi:malic enzyme
VHFEDLTYENASKVLNMYRTDLPCFNDDIQGIAAAVLAGEPPCMWPLCWRHVPVQLLDLAGQGSAWAGQHLELLAVSATEE